MPAVQDPRAGAAPSSSGARTIDTIDYADPGQALDRPAQRPRQRRADDSAGLLAARAARRTQPRVALIEDNTDNFVSVALAGTVGAMLGAYNQPATAARVPGQADARRRRGLSVRAVRPVPAAGLDRDVDLHDGDDRRRHHLHRRQGARPARGLSRHADHEARADRRLQHLGHDQGGAGRRRPDDHRIAHRRRSQSARSDAAASGCSS